MRRRVAAVHNVAPYRRGAQLPRPLGDVIAAGIQDLAGTIVDRIRVNRRSSMASYVLADEKGYVYVLRESAESEADAHPHWLVGCYRETPTLEEVTGDLLTHYETTRFRRRRLALKARS